MNINTHVSPMMNQHLHGASSGRQTSMDRVSGININSAKDDAASLQISGGSISGSSGQSVAVRNLNYATSLAQTADGALEVITNLQQRMRDLSKQVANGSNSEAERVAIQQEVAVLVDDLKHIAETTSFADIRLLDGTFGTRSFQVGPDNGEAVQLSLKDTRPSNAMMGVDAIDVTSVAEAQASIARIDAALAYVGGQRAELSAFLQRCEHAIANLDDSRGNVSASGSRIRDSDFAVDTSGATKSETLAQASASILAQAKQNPSAALDLLQ